MAIVKFEKNGQGFYDFADLLARTDNEFVEVLQKEIDFIENHGWEYEVIMKIDEKTIPIVFVKCSDIVEIFKFYSPGNFQHFSMNIVDFKLLAGVFND